MLLWKTPNEWNNNNNTNNNNNLGILDADTIKQVQMKEKFKKNISGELENYSRKNSIAEILSKEKIPGLYHSLNIPDPCSSGPVTNLNKWTKEQEN